MYAVTEVKNVPYGELDQSHMGARKGVAEGSSPFSKELGAAVSSIQRSASLQERNSVWNRIAREQPDLLTSNTEQGYYDTLEEARAADIRDKLIEYGLDTTTASLIAWREINTVVRRADGMVAGTNEMTSLPSSIRSSLVEGDPRVREGTGYAYIDRYGLPHVSKDLGVAHNWSGDGHVYEYQGRFGGGYALSSDNQRAFLALNQARLFPNDERDEYQAVRAHGKVVSTVPLIAEYMRQFKPSIQVAMAAYEQN